MTETETEKESMTLVSRDAGMDKETLETGLSFAPKFDSDGLIPCVCCDYETGELLMFAFMNEEALLKSVATGQAHYYSRSRKKLWLKGESSGQIQKIIEMKTDCDQDCVWIRVTVQGEHGGAACHTGYRSCFYRTVQLGEHAGEVPMTMTKEPKLFDPKEVYK